MVLSNINTVIRLGRHLARQVPAYGRYYALQLAYQAWSSAGQHIRLVRLMNTHAQLSPLTNQQLGFIYKYLGPYIAVNFSTHQRLSILINHYHFLTHQASPHFFNQVWLKPTLWQHILDQDTFAIRLEFPFGIDFEGDLALVFTVNSQPIYALSFTFTPASLVGHPLAHQTIFVSRVQGSKQTDLIRRATKQLHDITPATLLVVALQGIATAFHINYLLGVTTQNQLCASAEQTKGHFFDYDAFWESFGGQRHPDFYQMLLPFPEKPLATIKPNHRSRTVRKRHYKHLLSQSVCQYSQQFFLR